MQPAATGRFAEKGQEMKNASHVKARVTLPTLRDGPHTAYRSTLGRVGALEMRHETAYSELGPKKIAGEHRSRRDAAWIRS